LWARAKFFQRVLENAIYAKAGVQAAPARKAAATPVCKLYAEDLAEHLKEHREVCTEQGCNESEIALHDSRWKVVAMLQPGKLKEVFLAPYGRDLPSDYQPHLSLQLETGEEIRDLFNPDGNPECSVTGAGRPVCFTLLCHRRGVDMSINAKEPGIVYLVCAEPTCRQILGVNGRAMKLKLANRPKAKYPNIFFCPVHGTEPAYAICPHVLAEGASPLGLLPPTDTECGEAFCESCSKLYADRIEETKFKLVCEAAVNKALNGRLTELLAEAA
jgi:hypothetical protein